jgi:hypothetical protein
MRNMIMNRKIIISAIGGSILLIAIIVTSVLLTRDHNKDEEYNPWKKLNTDNVSAGTWLDVSSSLAEAGCSEIPAMQRDGWMNILPTDAKIILVKGSVLVTQSVVSDLASFQVYEFIDDTLQPRGDFIANSDFTPASELSVDLSFDGSTFVVGNPSFYEVSSDGNLASGFVQAYKFSDSSWAEFGQRVFGECDGATGCSPCLDQMYHELGSQVKVNGNGSRIVVSAPQSDCEEGPLTRDRGIGFVRIYDIVESSAIERRWLQVGNDIVRQEMKLGTAVQEFGKSLSISGGGEKVAIGSGDGMCGVFKLEDGVWVEVGDMWNLYSMSDSFYHPQYIALSDDGRRVAIGAESYGEELHQFDNTDKEGVVKIFEWVGNVWTQVGDDLVGPRGFGHTVGFSADGDIVAVRIVQGDASFCQVFMAPSQD